MKKVNVGGQALIEGVMIKSPDYVSVGVRGSKGKIKTKVEKFTSMTKKSKFLRLPFIRGIVILIEMLYVGMKELIFSANEQLEEEEEKESLSFWHILLTVGISLLFALLLFKAFPLFVTKLIDRYTTIDNRIFFNLIEGLIRIGVFVGYIVAISYLDDVKIMFRYHGAEHASISCYEHGKELNVENVRKFSTLHARCGTSFLVLTLLISILVFSLVPTNYAYWKLFLFRLPLILPLAGLSYEFLKLGDKYRHNWFFSQMVKPGLWLQKITTQKPNDKQIEVAIATLKALLDKHEGMKVVKDER
jgi:uncharacterized protein YqhQ